MTDIYLEEAHGCSDVLYARPSRDTWQAALEFRQDVLSQELAGQHDHPAFKVIDDALGDYDNFS
tara:strand:+ start:991 stop:1182 length:192 start_codon:yes stop_codon:yes gene_type:complete